MSKRKQTYVWQHSERTVTVTVQEFRDHVKIDMVCDKYGPEFERLFPEFQRWMLPILQRYGNDPRPIVMRHPLTGQVASIGGDEKQAIVAIATPIRKQP